MKLVKAAGFTTIVLWLLVLPGCSWRSRIINGQPPVSGKSSITGSVVAADGKPVANAVVYLCITEGDSIMGGCISVSRLSATRTDTSGIFWFKNMPPGEYFPVVRITESSQMVLQEKKKGAYLPAVVKYKLNADETMQIAPLRLEQSPETEAKSIRLTHPTNGESTTERTPTLAWEAVPGAGGYIVQLFKLHRTTESEKAEHPSRGEYRELEGVDLPGKPFWGQTATDTASLKIMNDLADGQYYWKVDAVVTTDDRDERASSQEALGHSSENDGYFTVAGTATNK